jgi:hypothetical protein
MERKIKRPLSVWIAQIILLLFSLMFLLTIFLPVATGLLAGRIEFLYALLPLAFSLTFITVSLVGFTGMVNRKRYGRWIGVGVLALFLAASIFGQVYRPQGPMEYYEYKNTAEVIGALIAQIVLGGLFLFLILHLAFAKKTTAFFSTGKIPADLPGPPLPPTFDS